MSERATILVLFGNCIVHRVCSLFRLSRVAIPATKRLLSKRSCASLFIGHLSPAGSSNQPFLTFSLSFATTSVPLSAGRARCRLMDTMSARLRAPINSRGSFSELAACSKQGNATWSVMSIRLHVDWKKKKSSAKMRTVGEPRNRRVGWRY